MNSKHFIIAALATLMACGNGNEQADAYGNFEVDETIVSAETSGKVLSLDVSLGDKLAPNQPIALIDTAQIALQVAQIEAQQAASSTRKTTVSAQISVLKEQLALAQTSQNRISKLFADKAATQQQLDEINGQVNVIQKQIEAQKSQFAQIDREIQVQEAQKAIVAEQLQKCRLVSPIGGTVLEKYIEQGEMVMPGKAIVKLANMDKLELRVYVSGDQLPHIKLGQQVVVDIDRDKTSNQSLNGEISWISSEAEFTPKIIQTKEERVKLVYAVKVNVKNDGRLKIGMPGEVRF